RVHVDGRLPVDSDRRGARRAAYKADARSARGPEFPNEVRFHKRRAIMTPTTAIEETPLTAEELDRGKRYLEQTKNQIVGALRHVAGAQWNYQPVPERWSIAQIAEHIIHVQELVLGPMREKLRQTPSTAPHTDYKLVDDIVIYQFPNRLNKFPSPIQSPG